MTDNEYMSMALSLAEKAKELDEVPVGALVVRGGRIVGEAYNTRESDKCATCHAELKAIEAACKHEGGWRLPGATLYVTLEPCVMCAGAIVNARIARVVFGAYDDKGGALGSKLDVNALSLNHTFEASGGVMEKECREILSSYFKGKRNKKSEI